MRAGILFAFVLSAVTTVLAAPEICNPAFDIRDNVTNKCDAENAPIFKVNPAAKDKVISQTSTRDLRGKNCDHVLELQLFSKHLVGTSFCATNDADAARLTNLEAIKTTLNSVANLQNLSGDINQRKKVLFTNFFRVPSKDLPAGGTATQKAKIFTSAQTDLAVIDLLEKQQANMNSVGQSLTALIQDVDPAVPALSVTITDFFQYVARQKVLATQRSNANRPTPPAPVAGVKRPLSPSPPPSPGASGSGPRPAPIRRPSTGSRAASPVGTATRPRTPTRGRSRTPLGRRTFGDMFSRE